METTQVLPKLDLAVLQEKANEFAMKGAIETLKDFYSGYDSPYRKAITEELKKQQMHGSIQLPDIIAILNDSLSKEIDMIANTAISKTFVPMVQQFLTRAEKEMNFSDILKEFIEITGAENMDDCSVSIEKSTHGWLDVDISFEDENYELTFHTDYHTEKEAIKKYQLLSLPRDGEKYSQTMKLKVGDGATLELPYTREILQNKFVSYIAGLVIANTKITMDCDGFSEEMFPKECHCD